MNFGNMGGNQMPGQGEFAQEPQGQPGPNFISQGDLTDEREQAYEQAFKDAAYSIFGTKHGPLVPSIVTFKVLKSTILEGDAFGAFILDVQGESVYVPVVMSDNMLKPMDIMYSKKMDQFVPFKKEWLDVFSAQSENSLGEGVRTPKHLPADKDISRLITPPMHGRTSYAMDLGTVDHLEIIKQASDGIKDQYKQMLKDDRTHLKFAFEHFAKEEITEALATNPIQEKVASVPVKLEVVDLEDPAMKVKEVFGNKANEAAKDMAEKGFAFKDQRQGLNDAFLASGESCLKLEEPSVSGFYKVFDSDGSCECCLVLVNPEGWYHGSYEGKTIEAISSPQGNVGESVYGDWSPKPQGKRLEYMVIKSDGDFFRTCDLVAMPCSEIDFTGKIKDQLFGKVIKKKVNGKNVIWIKTEGNIVASSSPMYVDRTEVGKDGALKYLKLDPFAKQDKADKKVYTLDQADPSKNIQREVVHVQTPTGKILNPRNSNTSFVPRSYRLVELGKELQHNKHLNKSSDILRLAQKQTMEQGGKTVKLANIGAQEFAVDGTPVGSIKEASYNLAVNHNISMHTSVKCFEKLSHFRDHMTIAVVPKQREKTASIFATGATGSQMSPENIQQDAMQQHASPMVQPQQNAENVQNSVQPPANPAMMNVGMQTRDPSLYSLGVLNTLSNNPEIIDLLAVYSPTLEKALDNVGRMLLTFWIKGSKSKESLGEDTYFSTEESLKTVFREMGSLLLKLNARKAAAPDSPTM